jgi:hypothetical protein
MVEGMNALSKSARHTLHEAVPLLCLLHCLFQYSNEAVGEFPLSAAVRNAEEQIAIAGFVRPQNRRFSLIEE